MKIKNYIIGGIILVLVIMASLFLVVKNKTDKITTFDGCRKAGWIVSSFSVYDSFETFGSKHECVLWGGKSFEKVSENVHEVIQTAQYTALYNDGTSEFVYRDDFSGSFAVYRAPIDSYWVDEKKAGWGWGPVGWRAPIVRKLGGDSNHVLFEIENSGSDSSCIQDIIIADRKTKQARKVNTELCVNNTLDEHDLTRFFGSLLSYKNIELNGEKANIVGVGDYLTGKTIAKSEVLLSENEYLLGSAVSDWEMSHVLFATGMCDTHTSDDTFVRVYDLNTQKGLLTDVTPKDATCQSMFNYMSDVKSIDYERSYGQTEKEGRFIFRNQETNKEEEIIIPE
jgi:hypothetical protein